MSDRFIGQTIDEYIIKFSPAAQERMQAIRKVIQDAAPAATEKISWQMPTFYYHGNLIHFASHKNHIGLYPGVEAIEFFFNRLVDYPVSKGAIQFPNNKPIPYDLIHDIVEFNLSLKEQDK